MKKPLLIHIPKTGGTSIVKALGLPRWCRVHRKIGGSEMRGFLLRHANNTHTFSFLRDPLDRAVSAYYFFVWDKPQGASPRMVLNSNTAPPWVFSCMARIADMDINSFYRGLLRDDALQYKRLSHVIVHFRPQSYWVDMASRATTDINFYDFGNYSDEFHRLCCDIGYDKGKHKPLHLMRSPRRKSWEDELAPDVQDMLRVFYKQDYELMDKVGIPYR